MNPLNPGLNIQLIYIPLFLVYCFLSERLMLALLIQQNLFPVMSSQQYHVIGLGSSSIWLELEMTKLSRKSEEIQNLTKLAQLYIYTNIIYMYSQPGSSCGVSRRRTAWRIIFRCFLCRSESRSVCAVTGLTLPPLAA